MRIETNRHVPLQDVPGRKASAFCLRLWPFTIAQTKVEACEQSAKFKLESLILAQDERWRRA